MKTTSKKVQEAKRRKRVLSAKHLHLKTPVEARAKKRLNQFHQLLSKNLCTRSKASVAQNSSSTEGIKATR